MSLTMNNKHLLGDPDLIFLDIDLG